MNAAEHRAIAETLLERVVWHHPDGEPDVRAESAEDRGRILAAQAHATLATIPDDGTEIAELQATVRSLRDENRTLRRALQGLE